MQRRVAQQPLATVNGRIITAGALGREMEQLAAAVYGKNPEHLVPAQRAELRKNSVTKLIREELVLTSELVATVADDDAELKRMVHEAELAILVDGGEELLSADGFQQRLRESVRRDLAIHRVIDLFVAEAELADGEVEAFYEKQAAAEGKGRFQRGGRVDIGEIFLPAEPTLCPAGRSALILSLRSFKERVENGESFSALARAHSQGEAAEADGRLGWVERGAVAADVYDAAAATKAGALSDVVPLTTGYGIYKVYAKELGLLPLAVVREEIVNELRNDRARAAFRLLVDGMMQQADIRVGAGPETWSCKTCNR